MRKKIKQDKEKTKKELLLDMKVRDWKTNLKIMILGEKKLIEIKVKIKVNVCPVN